MPEEIIRTFDAEIDSVLEGERAVVARINTAAIDRLRTVIDPLGADTTHFNKTASVLWQHGQDPIRGTVPIGHGWVKVRRAERDMLGKTKFGKDDFSQQLFDAYKEGTIRGWSIKAAVQDSSPPTKEEIRSNAALKDCEMIYRKWDLVEYSATPTPGNSDCLTLLVSRGLITPPDGFVPNEPKKEPWLPQLDGGQDVFSKEDRQRLEEWDKNHEKRSGPYIEATDGAWVVRNADASLVATFANEPLAEECLRLMVGGPSLSSRFGALFLELQALQANRQAEVKEYVDLYRYGRV